MITLSSLPAKAAARACRPQRQGNTVCIEGFQGMPEKTCLHPEHVQERKLLFNNYLTPEEKDSIFMFNNKFVA
jgi:hypothetical protein